MIFSVAACEHFSKFFGRTPLEFCSAIQQIQSPEVSNDCVKNEKLDKKRSFCIYENLMSDVILA